jgi:Ca2+-binding RTX toxin-like protein
LGGADTLDGGAGNDTLIGSAAGAGPVTLIGGTGDDRYQLSNGDDVITELAGGGNDTIELNFAGNYSLAALPSVEALVTLSTAGALLTGNDADNQISGNSGKDTLDGGLGNDLLEGFAGADSLRGGDDNDTLVGGAAGTGFDTLVGGNGDDRYDIFQTGDTITELAGGGFDSLYVHFAGNVSLLNRPAIEALYTDSSAATTLTGNDAANILGGGAGNDTLYGGLGNDTLIGGAGVDLLSGGAGDDVYYVDSLSDVVSESAASGTDLIIASTNDYSLVPYFNFENLTGNGVLTGNGLANLIAGGDGNDTIDGGVGADTLNGGLGNDVYIVDNAGDVLTDTGGVDTVRAKLAWTLTDGLENLELLVAGLGSGNALANKLSGTAGNDSLYGFGGDDQLIGNAGDDRLDGGAGKDKLTGGAGNDTYIVDFSGDSIVELTNGGFDLILASSASYTMASGTEAMVFTGTGNFNGTGNAQANRIEGGVGADTLNGAAGADTLVGGAGNDTYLVNNSGDVIDDTSGFDTVITTLLTATLADGLEALTYRSSGNFVGTGNAAANAITSANGNDVLDGAVGNDTLTSGSGNDLLLGGEGNDVLFAGSGNDILTGGTGSDPLAGGTGLDSFRFIAAEDSGLGASADTITDFVSGEDKLDFSAIDTSPADGDQGFVFIAGAAFSATGVAEINAVVSGGGFLVSADINGDGISDMTVLLSIATTLTGTDFLL